MKLAVCPACRQWHSLNVIDGRQSIQYVIRRHVTWTGTGAGRMPVCAGSEHPVPAHLIRTVLVPA